MASEAVSEAAGGRLFTRQATGLVRSVSPLSHIIFNTFTAPAMFVLAIALFWTLGAFPGGNIYVALALGYISGIVFAFAISTVASAIPRSGGDYVFVGRVIHPVVGIASSFCFTAGVLLSAAGIALFLVTGALAPSLDVIGVVSHSHTFVNWGTTLETNHGWQFGVGIGFILACAVLAGIGWKWSLRVQNVGFVLSGLGLFVTAVVVLANSGHDFISQFNSFANPITGSNDSYHGIIAAAQKQGINTSPGSHFINTWPAYGAVIGFSIYAFYSTHISGEVRQAKTWRTPMAMAGAAFINMGLCLIMTWVFFHGFGTHFFSAANAVNGTDAWPFSAPPIFTFVASSSSGCSSCSRCGRSSRTRSTACYRSRSPASRPGHTCRSSR
jgi:amino acid transporter